MLSPEYIAHVADEAEKLAEQIHNQALKDIIKRIMIRIGAGEDVFLSATDKWQIESMQEAGYLLEDIQRALVKYTGLMQSEILDAMEDVCVETLRYDNAIYKAAGLETETLSQSPFIKELLHRNYEAAMGTWKGFTKTMPSAGHDTYIKATDKAYNLVASGTISYSDAVRIAINDIADKGIKVKYPSGHEDTIETATLRAVRTGISQATGDITMQRLIKMDWDTILVSAHYGARTGDGEENPSNHLWWQGKFYSRTGKDKRFLPFSVTGYGTGEGLCGWNCRHSFGAGDGVNNPYDISKIDKEESKKAYELSQEQRKRERDIRRLKRKAVVLKEAINNCKNSKLKEGLQDDYRNTSRMLISKFNDYKGFCEDNGLKSQYNRTDVGKYTSEINESILRTVREQNEQANLTINQRINNGEYNLNLSEQQYQKHVEGTAKWNEYFQSRRIPQGKITISQEEVQSIITQYAGKGDVWVDKSGNVSNKAFVTVDKVIGQYYNNGKWTDTKRIAIHYGKKGTHIVPVKEKR